MSEKVSDCCGRWFIEHEVEMPDGTIDESYECTRCHRSCKPIEKEGDDEKL